MHVDIGAVVGGDFEIVRYLNEGGMGIVYQAQQRSTGVARALKVLSPDVAASPDLRAKFVQEAKVGGMIRSEHVVQVLAAGVDGPSGALWLVMELLQGQDLGHFVASVLPDLETARRIFQQLFHGIAAAHDAGVIHRDLKPENIFVARSLRADEAMTIKVLDFGIAKITAEVRTQKSLSFGTPFWMAPEQASMGATITPSTDVWALGLIAFFVITGRPFWKSANLEAVTPATLMFEVCSQPIPTATERHRELGGSSALPAGFDDWFGRCVDRRPELRFPDAGAAWRGLEPLLRPSAETPAAPRPLDRTDPRGPLALGRTEAAGHEPDAALPAPAAAPRAPGKTTRAATKQISVLPWILAGGVAVLGGALGFTYWGTDLWSGPRRPRSSSSGGAMVPLVSGASGSGVRAGPRAPFAREFSEARRLYLDRGHPENNPRAISVFREACNAGNQDGCAGLGWAEGQGFGMPKDDALAFKTVDAACSAGSLFGCVYLSKLYFRGRAVARDPARAKSLDQSVCDAGEMLGCHQLGYEYYLGIGVAKDQPKAIELYRKACDGGAFVGCSALGLVYLAGDAVPADYRLAQTYLQKGCDGGDMSGCSNWARMYDKGQGVEKSHARSVELEQKACDGGEPTACNNLGLAFDNGDGVPRNEGRAAVFYQQSCDGGLPDGCKNLGTMYLDGRGVPVDDDRAIALFQRGCAGEMLDACQYLRERHLPLTPPPPQ